MWKEHPLSPTLIAITAGDAPFFSLLQGTIDSVRANEIGKRIPLAVLDCGFTAKQLNWLKSRVNLVMKPDLPFSFPDSERQPEFVKGLMARPWLRDLFPGNDYFLWLDADCWIQDWSAVELFLEGARRRGLAIVPEVDRGSKTQYGNLPWFWNFMAANYEKAFDRQTAQRLLSYPILNAGVFCLHGTAPHWDVWKQHLHTATQKTVDLFTDQTVLNYVVYSGPLFERTELLPSWCNWTCHFGMPGWDRQRSCFVEPYLPHTRIGIIHLSGKVKHERVALRSTDGGFADVNMRFDGNRFPCF